MPKSSSTQEEKRQIKELIKWHKENGSYKAFEDNLIRDYKISLKGGIVNDYSNKIFDNNKHNKTK